MKNKKVFKIVLFIGVLAFALIANNLVSGIKERKHFTEKPVSSNISSPSGTPNEIELISLATVEDLHELFLLPKNEMGMVIAIAEAQEPDILQVVYENGAFIRWEMNSQKILALQPLFSGQTEEKMGSNKLPVNKINAGVVSAQMAPT